MSKIERPVEADALQNFVTSATKAVGDLLHQDKDLDSETYFVIMAVRRVEKLKMFIQALGSDLSTASDALHFVRHFSQEVDSANIQAYTIDGDETAN